MTYIKAIIALAIVLIVIVAAIVWWRAQRPNVARTGTISNGNVTYDAPADPTPPTPNVLPGASDTQCPSCYSEWVYGECSAKCGGGTRSATRNCTATKQTCTSPMTKTEPCNTDACATYSAWGAWEGCGCDTQNMLQYRRRTCLSGACDDIVVDTKICYNGECGYTRTRIDDFDKGIEQVFTYAANKFHVVAIWPVLNEMNGRTYRTGDARFPFVLARLVYEGAPPSGDMFLQLDAVDKNGVPTGSSTKIGGIVTNITPTDPSAKTYTFGPFTFLDVGVFTVNTVGQVISLEGSSFPLGAYTIAKATNGAITIKTPGGGINTLTPIAD